MGTSLERALQIGVVALLGCRGEGVTTDTGDDGSSPSTEGDADADADADADGDADPGTGDRLFDDEHVLVVPGGDGLTLLAHDGSVAVSATWTALVGSCTGCGGEGASADGDGLLVSFTTGGFGGMNDSAIARLDATGTLDFRVDGFEFAHDAVRDPADDTILVPEATSDQIRWVAGDGSSAAAVRLLDAQDDGWDGGMPNGVDRFDFEGGSYLVSSHRGAGGGGGGGPGAPVGGGSGEITLWDITSPDTQDFVWRYPTSGSLDTPHGALFREYDGRWWLLYAHSYGADDGNGSVGLAVTDDPTVAPSYVADLVPVGAVAPFTFLRGVELTSDGWLYLTDSGGMGGFGGGANGRVVFAPMPALDPTGAGGGIGDQVFVDLDGADVLHDGLANPFEGFLWVPTFPLE